MKLKFKQWLESQKLTKDQEKRAVKTKPKTRIGTGSGRTIYGGSF